MPDYKGKHSFSLNEFYNQTITDVTFKLLYVKIYFSQIKITCEYFVVCCVQGSASAP